PATPKPPATGSRPKMKTGHSTAAAGQPAVETALPTPALSALPAAPAALAAPSAPRMSEGSFSLSAASAPEPEPRPGRQSRPARAESADSTLEERLERLEKMVESIMARGYAPPNPYPMKPSADKVGQIERRAIANIATLRKRDAEMA